MNVATIRRVKDALSFDLLGGDESVAAAFRQLDNNPILLCDVLYVLCKPQADERSVSDVEFGESLAGDSIHSASVALRDALVEFFPEKKRLRLQEIVKKSELVEAEMMKMTDDKIKNLDVRETASQAMSVGELSTKSQVASA